MILEQLYTDSLSQASYLIGDESSGLAVVVDPLRDIQQYLDAAHRRGLTIVGVFLTHFHADFLAGHLELAEETGAWIGLGERARAGFDARLFSPGERLRLGEVVVEVMQTPGHTPESISILVYESADDDIACAVLTGDSLFVGDVGRVDLQASFGADPVSLAHEQYETIQHTLMSLPDPVRVFPAHGAGSACGKNLSPDRHSTIGRERATNLSCRPMSADDFVDMITTGQLPVPGYFIEDARLNRERHALFDAGRTLRRFAPEELGWITMRGMLILDTRDVEPFVRGHLAGALNVPLEGRFAETAGMFLDFAGSGVVLVAESGQEREALRQLARIGFDDVAGYVSASNLDDFAAAGLLVTGERVDATAFDALRSELRGEFLLDVRSPGEFGSGAIPDAVNIPLPQLRNRAGEIPLGSKVLVNCASGWRSGVAASYLASSGYDVSDLRGGYQAWQRQMAV